MTLLTFMCYVGLVALIVKFCLTLAEKWGILSWIQVHTHFDLIYEWSLCSFCQSFWLGLLICIPLAICIHWTLIFIPLLSCNLR